MEYVIGVGGQGLARRDAVCQCETTFIVLVIVIDMYILER
jgi:hypothetical protein